MGRTIADVDDLSPTERLDLVEELWNSLCDVPDSVPVTAAQRAELDRRLHDLERNGSGGIPWDEVLRRIRRTS